MAKTTTRNGTDIALDSDDLDNFDFIDGLDDLEEDNNEPIEDELETDDETDGESAEEDDDLEPEDASEEDDAEDDDSENSDEEDDVEDDTDGENDNQDDSLVELSEGQEVTLGELKQGYMRQQDYSRKLSHFGERVKMIEGQGETLQNVTTVFAEFIAKNLPPEPDQSLAFSNPQAHYQQKVAYDNAVKQLNELIAIGKNVQKVNQGTRSVKTDEELRQEQEALRSLYPSAFKNQKAKTQFFTTAFDAAREAGFSDDEIRANEDHRLIVLAYKARLYDQSQKKAKNLSEATSKTGKKKRTRFVPGKKNNAARNKVGSQTRRTKARERLMRDDSVENAAALLSS